MISSINRYSRIQFREMCKGNWCFTWFSELWLGFIRQLLEQADISCSNRFQRLGTNLISFEPNASKKKAKKMWLIRDDRRLKWRDKSISFVEIFHRQKEGSHHQLVLLIEENKQITCHCLLFSPLNKKLLFVQHSNSKRLFIHMLDDESWK